jgi:hypothetical protein
MRYEMKHAKKPERKKVNAKFNRKKIIAITLGSIAVIAVIVLCVLYYEIIFNFIDSKIDFLSDWFSGGSTVEDSNVPEEPVETAVEDDNTQDNMEELPEESEEEPKEEEEEEETEEKTAPTIKLEVYENATLEGGVCYWRVRAVVTGDPVPKIKWNKDDSLGSLGDKIAQVNLNDPSETFTLTATATNSEGAAVDSINLIWECNSKPLIKGISLSEDVLYVGKQYQVFVDVSDVDNDVLSFNWVVTGGSIVDNTANPIEWKTPDTTGDYKISVVVNDGHGNTAESSVAVYVGEVTEVTEVTVENNPENITIPKKTGEGGYIEYGGGTHIGADIYAGDSDGNLPCSGFVSFDISDLGGSTVESASLTLSSASISGDPLKFLKKLNINVLKWGAEPITQSDFELDGYFIASYNSPNITCNSSVLKEKLQEAINGGKSRFQVRIHFSGPYTDGDSQADGWRYSQSNVNLNVTVIR